MTGLTATEREALMAWWNADWPHDGSDVLDALAVVVEAILAARLAAVEALADEYDRSENWRVWGVPQAIRRALDVPGETATCDPGCVHPPFNDAEKADILGALSDLNTPDILAARLAAVEAAITEHAFEFRSDPDYLVVDVAHIRVALTAATGEAQRAGLEVGE